MHERKIISPLACHQHKLGAKYVASIGDVHNEDRWRRWPKEIRFRAKSTAIGQMTCKGFCHVTADTAEARQRDREREQGRAR